MSEYHPRVVRLGPVIPHPNADRLDTTDVSGYTCITKRGEFRENDLAAYVPVDAVVPDRPEWRFLAPNSDISPDEPLAQRHRRIRARRLRGIFSMGILVPAPKGLKEGDDVSAALGLEKWEPQDSIGPQEGDSRESAFVKLPWYARITKGYFWKRLYWRLLRRRAPGETLVAPGLLQEYTDVEGLRKYRNILKIGETVVLREKVHGANLRAAWCQNRLWVGSHYQWKRRPKSWEPRGWFWAAAEAEDLETKLRSCPDLEFFGEVVPVQKGFGYGSTGYRVLFFDILDTSTGRYFDDADLENTCAGLGLGMVPVVYRGPWMGYDQMKACGEGPSLVPGANHIREGFVVRPQRERFEPGLGRCVLKYPGEQYLLLK